MRAAGLPRRGRRAGAVSAKAWTRFVEQRRRELHADYPCAAPSARRSCPRHRKRIVEICQACRGELNEQLAREYAAAEIATPDPLDDLGPSQLSLDLDQDHAAEAAGKET